MDDLTHRCGISVHKYTLAAWDGTAGEVGGGGSYGTGLCAHWDELPLAKCSSIPLSAGRSVNEGLISMLHSLEWVE